jgi:hypothetical protein
MQIERARFLVLVSTIAAACGPRHPANDAPIATAGADAGTTSGVEGGVPIPATVNATTTSTSPWPASEGKPPVWGNGPSNEGAGTWPAGNWPAAEGYPAGEGYVPPVTGKKKKPPSPQCGVDENVGTPGNCQALKIDKSCAPFPFINAACADSAKFMKPKIAERAVACIRTKSPMQLCDAMSVYDCKDDALHTACPDPSSDGDCATIRKACPKTTASECRTYLSGLNALGRGEMVKCMKTDCTYGLYSCSEGL